MSSAAAILGGVGALVAAVASVGSWLAARQANQAAATLARIERDRWHADLTPKFEVTCQTTGADVHAGDPRYDLVALHFGTFQTDKKLLAACLEA